MWEWLMKLLTLFGLGNSRDKDQDDRIAALAARVAALEAAPPGGADTEAREAAAAAVAGVAAVGARLAVIEAEFTALEPLMPAP